MMHEGELMIDGEQVRRLVSRQFPQWIDLPIKPMPIGGTDHALFRIGTELIARMPRIEWAIGQAELDCRWLPVLAPYLPVAIPVPIAIGEPGEGFPWPWSVVPWLAGENPTDANAELDVLAVEMAEFNTAMRSIDTAGGPLKTGTQRGMPLAVMDEMTRGAIKELGDRIDTDRVVSAWESALSAAPWTREPSWIHGDLAAGNLLVHKGHLSAVIDFGALGLGDPAIELMPAWSMFDARSRRIFREAQDCDEDTWQRGRGWALLTSLIALPYYWNTGPALVAESQRKIAAVLSEPA